MSNTANTPKSFEAAMRRLEEIAGLLEDGEAALSESLELYKEGAELAAWCSDQLKNARQQVNMLSKEGYSDSQEDESQ